MFSLNRIEIIGYQTQPVALRQTPGGTSVTDLNIVVPYSYKSEGGEQLSGKSFHTVTLWGPMADVAGQYVRPGAQLYVSGRLQTDGWEDEKTGEKRTKTKVVALDMILLDPKDGQTPAPANARLLTDSLNRAQVIGNVTRDPELRTTTSGHQVLTLGIATNERWRDKASGENKERTEFHSVVVWGELATQVNQNVRKGQRVYVSGRVQTRSWETQQGQKRATTEIVADQVSMLGVRNEEAMASMQTDALAPQRSAPRARKEAEESSAPRDDGDDFAPIPEISYKSEIKAEDLPF